MPDGRKLVLHPPGRLAALRNPYDPEPVSVLPGRAIVCKTHNGWSLHNLKGSLVGFFPAGGYLHREGWWPFYRNGHFYLQVNGGMHYDYYRMDVPTGKLVFVGQRY